ncbi:MAG: aldose 1-epimerase family protein [Vicinamibacterales bacterium]|nr:aldose 1-epimerase family protein [Vicinamibacterales bacterium]
MRTILTLFCLSFLTVALLAQGQVDFEGRPALRLSNGKLELTVFPEGGAMAELVFVGQKDRFSPIWNPSRLAREAGLAPPTSFSRGHFVCVDGFGPVSAEERAVGLPMHGEAQALPWNLDSYQQQSGTTSATFSVKLPLAQEILTRTYRVVQGENIVWVNSELENLLSFDRPVFWGEHATIGAPFLEPGKVAVDMPVQRAKTKAYQMEGVTTNRQLPSFVDFSWPMAPTRDGGRLDLRSAPLKPGSLEHSTSLLDTSRQLGFVTALNTERKLLIGWVFRREEFPWVQTWLSYPAENRMVRGLEFATQPFDLPRADVLKAGPLFDTPVFRMLPARSRIAASFLMFYTQVPEGFGKVDDVRLENGTLIIEDRTAARTIRLAASRSLVP